MTTCTLLYLLWLTVLYLVEVQPSPIWRCPDVKLLPCKTLPKHCTSFRMIYIRHVHLECPACLICADPWEVKPWSQFKAPPKSRNKRTEVKNAVVETETPTEEVKPLSEKTPPTKEEKRRLRKQRRERKEKRRKRKQERRLRRQRRRLHKKSNTTKTE